jgi:sigma-B regulation protein RsbU (phosphoserine phosphatase)
MKRNDRPSGTSSRLLVVDDDEMNRDMLSRRLARKGFDVSVAEDGAAALAAIDSNEFDLVLLDIMMPGIDGFQVLERLRQEFSPLELPVIMATAKGASDDIVSALRLGANDYVTKPLDFPVVLARVETHLALRNATRQVAAAHERMKNDLEAAAKIQLSLIPKEQPQVAGCSFAWRYRPCDELAGDIFDVFQIAGDRIGLYLLDVSGHGVPAALLSVTLSRVLSQMPTDELGPGALAERLNKRFPMDPETRQYFTIAYGELDPAARVLSWTSAAHPGPVLVDRKGLCKALPAEGFAIGWFPHAEYEERREDLAPGDRLYFFSDGVVEATDDAGDEFGVGRLQECVSRHREQSLETSLDELLAEVVAWCGDEGPADDVSLLAFELT